MPKCVTCGGEEYELIDGMYYCSICQTQSQVLREEEVDEEEENRGYSQSLVIRQQKIKKEKPVKDKGRPWHTPEGWTVIIKYQVEALIKLGADPKLKDVVLRLWVLYLSKCGLAFNTDKKDPLPLSIFRDRDRSIPSVSDPQVINTKASKTMKKKAAMTSMKRINEQKESQELKKSLHGIDFYDGDNPFEESDSSNSDSDAQEAEDLSEDADDESSSTGKKKSKSSKVMQCLRSPEMLTPTRALVFSYIGVMYLHEAFSPFDLVRWVNMNKVPMKRQVLSSFPVDMKLSGTDYSTFVVNRIPTVRKIRKEAARICQFLGIVGSKHVDLELFCSRYIVELKLPGEFHYLVRVMLQIIPHKLRIHKFVARAESDPTKDNLVFVETDIFAMAVIVVLMKVIFVLDDNSERQFTDFARKLKKNVSSGKSPFIFEDWLHYMEYCLQNLNFEYFPEDINDIGKIRNIELYVKQYEQEQVAATDYVESNISIAGKKSRTKSCHRDVQDMLKETLTSLKEKFEYHYSHGLEQLLQSQKESVPESDNSIPGFSKPTSFISMLEESAKERDTEHQKTEVLETEENPVNATGDKFKTSSVRYILQTDFLSDSRIKLLSEGYNVSLGSTLSNSNDDICNTSRESEKLDNDIIFSQSEFITSTQDAPSSKGEDQQKPTASVSEKSETEQLEMLLKFQDELNDLTSKKKYWFRDLKSVKPRSYDRVLQICSKKVGCSVSLLDKFVHQVEIIYLSSKEHGAGIYSWKGKFTKQYFDVPQTKDEF